MQIPLIILFLREQQTKTHYAVLAIMNDTHDTLPLPLIKTCLSCVLIHLIFTASASVRRANPSSLTARYAAGVDPRAVLASLRRTDAAHRDRTGALPSEELAARAAVRVCCVFVHVLCARVLCVRACMCCVVCIYT